MKKQIYLAVILGAFLVFAISLVLVSGTNQVVSNNSTSNMTYGKCVKLATQSKTSCLNTTKNTYSTCKKSAGKDKTKLKQCKTSFDTTSNTCKKTYKDAKTDCKRYPMK